MGSAVQVLRIDAVVVVRVRGGRVVVARVLQLATALGLSPAQGLEGHVLALAVREDLHVHLTAEHAVRRELSDQHTQVVSSHTVRRAIQGEPTTPVFTGEVNVLSSLKGGHPGLSFDEAHLSLPGTRVGGVRQAHRHPAVVGELGEGIHQHRVDVVGIGRADRALVEAGVGADERRVIHVAGHGAHEVVGILQRDIHLVGRQAIDAIHDGVDVHVVRSGGGVYAVAGAVVTASVVGRGGVVVVTREGIGTAKGLEHRDRLGRRIAVATGIDRRERPDHEGKVVGAGVGLLTLEHRHAAAVVARLCSGSRQVVVHAHREVGWHTREDRRHRIDDGDGLHILAAVAAGVHRSERAQDGGAAGTLSVEGLVGGGHGHAAAVVLGHHIGSGDHSVTGNGGVGGDLGKRRGSGIDDGDDLDVDGLVAAIVCDAPRAGDLLADARIHVEHGGVIEADGVAVAIRGGGHLTQGSRADVISTVHGDVGRGGEHRSGVVHHADGPGGRGAVAGGVRGRVGAGHRRQATVTRGHFLEAHGELRAEVFRLDVGRGQGVVAPHGHVGREVHEGRGHRVHMRSEAEHHEVAKALGLAVREDLHVELTAQVTVGGELGEQDTLVVAGHPVGEVAGGVPSASEEAVDGETLAVLEFRGPALGLGKADGGLTASEVRSLVDADRHPAVVLEGRERIVQGRVDSVREHTTELVLVEGGRGAHNGRVVLIAAHRRHDVIGVRGSDVEPVGAHARDAVEGDDLLLETVLGIVAGRFAAAEVAAAVVVGGRVAVVAGRGVGTTGHFQPVTDPVSVHIGDAVAVTVDVLVGREGAEGVVRIRGVAVVVAG